MICQITKTNRMNLLTDLLLDEASVSPDLRSHVEQCEECKRELAELKASMAELDLAFNAWEAPEPSPYFDARMSALLRAEREREPAGFFERLRARLLFGSNMQLRPLAAGALALLILAGGGTFAGLMHSTQPAPSGPSAVVRDLQSLDENSQVFQQLSALDQQDDSSDSEAPNNTL
jgi:anti-sigma factor RsiW